VKTILILTLSGALIGAAAAAFIVPPLLSWYATPGGVPPGTQTMVQMPDVVRYVSSKMIQGQGIGAAIGAVMGLVIGVMARRRKPVKSA
jgi:hypothetical protein